LSERVVLVSLTLDLRPRRALVSKTREFLADLCEGIIRDPDETYRVTMAAHELLENLVKYSSGTSRFEICLYREEGQEYVAIDTNNPASAASLLELGRLFQRFESMANTKTAYEALIRTSETRSGSGLGLARIRAEARMRLTCHIVGERVSLRARAPVYSVEPPHE
jgi:two-component sensor histidine kinase